MRAAPEVVHLATAVGLLGRHARFDHAVGARHRYLDAVTPRRGRVGLHVIVAFREVQGDGRLDTRRLAIISFERMRLACEVGVGVNKLDFSASINGSGYSVDGVEHLLIRFADALIHEHLAGEVVLLVAAYEGKQVLLKLGALGDGEEAR